MFRVLPLLVVLALSACSRSTSSTESNVAPQGAAATASALPEPTAKPVPAELPDLIARVNGEAIQKADFEKALLSFEANSGGPVPDDHRNSVIRSVLDQMIGYKLLVQEAKNRKIVVPDTDIQARIAQIRSQYPNEQAFGQALIAQEVTLAELTADTRSDLLVNSMLEREFSGKIAITAAEADDFYAKNPDQFKQPERVRASHILIGFPANAAEMQKAAARARAAEVLRALREGKDFAELAKEHSTDSGSAQNGGDLGFFQQGQMVEAFDKAAFSMKEGETSGLIETQFGFHIIRVIEKMPGRDVPLEEVRAEIQRFLEGRARQQATQSFVESLKAKSKVEIFI